MWRCEEILEWSGLQLHRIQKTQRYHNMAIAVALNVVSAAIQSLEESIIQRTELLLHGQHGTTYKRDRKSVV